MIFIFHTCIFDLDHNFYSILAVLSTNSENHLGGSIHMYGIPARTKILEIRAYTGHMYTQFTLFSDTRQARPIIDERKYALAYARI